MLRTAGAKDQLPLIKYYAILLERDKYNKQYVKGSFNNAFNTNLKEEIKLNIIRAYLYTRMKKKDVFNAYLNRASIQLAVTVNLY